MFPKEEVYFTVKKGTKIAVHRPFHPARCMLFIGMNPYGPRGGKCGVAVDAVKAYECSYKPSQTFTRYAAILNTYCEVHQYLNLPEDQFTVKGQHEILAAARKRKEPLTAMMILLLRRIPRDELPLLINRGDISKPFRKALSEVLSNG